MMKRLCILGSTGSIGTQTLEVVRGNRSEFQVTALTAGDNITLLVDQIAEFHPQIVAVKSVEGSRKLKQRLKEKGMEEPEITAEMDGFVACATHEEVDLVVAAMVGMIGLQPVIKAIQKKKDIALANKETLVTAGHLIMDYKNRYQVNLYPVDSEHSAIFQCLQSGAHDEIEEILLTASGGPFRDLTAAQLADVTVDQALAHPNWSMGKKITIDSATMINKGLEIIEACWLFQVPIEKIHVLVQPNSVIHSMVQFQDGAVIAQLGTPDMRLPIQLALTWPQRVPCKVPRMSLAEVAKLTFYAPDYEAFPALNLAKHAASLKGDRGAVLNGANEAAVGLFLNDKIGFTDIAERVAYALDTIPYKKDITLDDVLAADKAAREIVLG